MKRLLLLLAFIPSIASAQVNISSPTGFQWSSGSGTSGSIIAGVTLASGCTANWLLYTDSTGHVNCAANMTFNGTLVTFTGNSGATGIFVVSLAGATGAADSVGMSLSNVSTGTTVNYGIKSTALAASAGGTQVGGFFQSGGAGNAAFAYGVWGQANTGANAGVATVGIAGNASSGARRIGGIISTNLGFTPTLPSVAASNTNMDLLLTHPTLAADYLVLADGTGLPVYEIKDNGSPWGANSKALTDAGAAVAFAIIVVSSGTTTGGQLDYCIEVIDATPNYQNRCGSLVYTAVNKAGTITVTCVRPGGSSTLNDTTDFLAASSGTMTDLFTCVDGGSANLQFKVTADSSLTPTTERINYFVRQWGNTADSFIPQ